MGPGLRRDGVICTEGAMKANWIAAPKAGTHFDMGTGLRRCGETGKHAGMTEDVVISAQGLTKRYGATIAVDHIDLDVRAGEIVGILGPNGSGKTTTIL